MHTITAGLTRSHGVPTWCPYWCQRDKLCLAMNAQCPASQCFNPAADLAWPDKIHLAKLKKKKKTISLWLPAERLRKVWIVYNCMHEAFFLTDWKLTTNDRVETLLFQFLVLQKNIHWVWQHWQLRGKCTVASTFFPPFHVAQANEQLVPFHCIYFCRMKFVVKVHSM